MRKVQIYKHESPDSPSSAWNKIKDGMGIFHQFGVDYEEFDNGPVNYTTAIVEMLDGTIRSVPVENIKFLTVPDRPPRGDVD